MRNDATGGACRHFVVTFAVKEFSSTQFVYPADFLPAISARAEFDLAPGENRVVSARWPAGRVPPVGAHPCLLAAVIARGDHPAPGTHVWEHANLAQKNLTVVDLLPGDFAIVPVVIANLRERTRHVLEVWRAEDGPLADVALVHRAKGFFARPTGLRPLAVAAARPVKPRLMDCGGAEPHIPDCIGGILHSTRPERIARRFPDAVERRLKAEPRVRVPVELPPGATTTVGLKVAAPDEAHPGACFVVHLIQRDGSRIVGGVAVEVRVPRSHGQPQ